VEIAERLGFLSCKIIATDGTLFLKEADPEEPTTQTAGKPSIFNQIFGLGLELPVACSTIAGNAQEGKHYIVNREQILRYHGKTSKIDLADAKYDEHDNYKFSRAHGAIPIIDYNPRNGNRNSLEGERI